MVEPVISEVGSRSQWRNLPVNTLGRALLWIHHASNYCQDEYENYHERMDWTIDEGQAFLRAAETLDELFIELGP